jgi:hypothetical protein
MLDFLEARAFLIRQFLPAVGQPQEGDLKEDNLQAPSLSTYGFIIAAGIISGYRYGLPSIFFPQRNCQNGGVLQGGFNSPLSEGCGSCGSTDLARSY